VQARVHWLQTAGERLPFVDGAFDRVICTETLEHVDDDAVLARELVRVLKPGGILAVSVPDEFSEKIFWKLSKNYRTHAGGHVRIYERERIVRLLRDAGLEPYAVRYRHSLETMYWLSHIAFWSDWGKQGPITRVFRRALDSQRGRESRIVSALDDIGNRILPKSIVVYSRKPLGAGVWAPHPDANGYAQAPLTVADDTPHEFGAPEHMPPEIRQEPPPEPEDERESIEVRAVPAPFAIDPPDAPAAREPGAPPLSLRDELRIAQSLRGDEQKRRMIEILRSCRYALMRETQDMSGEQASTPLTEDGRTMKEIVGHITGWERWTAVALREIAAGSREPSIMSLSGYPIGIGRYASIDAFNGARMAEARERPWADVLDESAEVFDDMLAAIEATPAGAMAQTAPFYWPGIGGTVPCGLYLLMVAAHHYQEEHLPEVTRGRAPAR
jgi:predicted SAM-dependent methyltransferase